MEGGPAMPRLLPRLILAIACLGFGLSMPALASAGADAGCLWCHNKEPYTTAFPDSAHAMINCATCHQGIEDVYLHKAKEEKSQLLACTSCHKDVERKYGQDVHFTMKQQNCQSCHKQLHSMKKSDPATLKATVIATCTTECHKDVKDIKMGHAAAVLRGNNDSASCADCHALHQTKAVKKGVSEEARAANRLVQTRVCMDCHSDPEIIARNKLNPMVVSGFASTYHGKALKFGETGSFAGCADCHGDHNMLPAKNALSPVAADNRRQTCGKCHSGFANRFTDFIAHPDQGDRQNYPLLYWTSIFMEWLLGLVFVFFGIHTFLWWRKAYWLKWSAGPTDGHGSLADSATGTVYVRRFALRYRLMHVLLIASFMLLVLTGMPIKYSGSGWAQTLMGLFGGPANAAVWHRGAATVLIIEFLYVCWLSLRYLFFGATGTNGWLGRLFGPESLCPNMKDWHDIKGMFKWFVGRGEMPRFERWTYFEKFDFFAVFWGMFIIGGSGLIMWFPEKFSYLFPGWLINIATIAHSEEALLAAIFIFTVHFFHNHLAPNKFPMEDNIFTGRNTLAELQHDRPAEYERIIAEDRLEEITTEPPSLAVKLLSALYGYGAVVLGVVLTVLILVAIFW
ncbi:MAG: cytochrome C [Desulfopila sp.]